MGSNPMRLTDDLGYFIVIQHFRWSLGSLLGGFFVSMASGNTSIVSLRGSSSSLCGEKIPIFTWQ